MIAIVAGVKVVILVVLVCFGVRVGGGRTRAGRCHVSIYGTGTVWSIISRPCIPVFAGGSMSMSMSMRMAVLGLGILTVGSIRTHVNIHIHTSVHT